MVGGLIMVHGDDRGLRLPPAVAPAQVVVCVVREGEGVGTAASRLREELQGVGLRVELDDSTATSFGRRVVDWELKGVPVRVEIGPRDVEASTAVLARRDTGEKEVVRLAEVVSRTRELLGEIQEELLRDAREFRDRHTVSVGTASEAAEAARSGWASIPWTVLGEEGESRLAEDGVSVRCLVRPDGGPAAEDDPDAIALAARAY
ncbi:MAG: hypothetical protein KatS3mg008_0678 [Acidimicrobiales bacterium]|nr:MAG: hypothetical protein KatS3mg008_0678 [Acidimicrobiales bacterium]